MSDTILYDKPSVGDVWVSVWPDASESATIIGVKESANGQWQAVLWGGFRNPLRVAQGEGWNSRSQWHPLRDDHVLFPAAKPVEPTPVAADTAVKKRGAV